METLQNAICLVHSAATLSASIPSFLPSFSTLAYKTIALVNNVSLKQVDGFGALPADGNAEATRSVNYGTVVKVITNPSVVQDIHV
ncbi:hypothetical protein NC651_037878 [Populus alba x Populus x berolinensis]|nr:hypothetical protein NC651_037878 [Populus alba x Populus x berolinensis]